MSRTRRLVWTKRMRGTLPSAQVRRPSMRRRTTAATSARAVSGSGARATYSAASSSAPSSTCASGRTGWRAICSASMAAASTASVRPMPYGLLTVERVPDEVTDGWVQPFLSQRGVRRDTVKLLRGIDPRELIAAGDKLRDFDHPALLAWGTADRAFKLSLAHRLAERLPRARVEVIEGARTFVAEDQPERLARLIAGFVREEAPLPSAGGERSACPPTTPRGRRPPPSWSTRARARPIRRRS